MTLPSSPADRHRAIAEKFTEKVQHVQDWEAPSPVEGWNARDVVGHLVQWLPGFLAGGAGVELPSGPSPDVDPVSAWQVHCDGVQAVLEDPGTANRFLENPHVGKMPLAVAIDQIYTPDVFMHTWDLSKASGQEAQLDSEFCGQLLAGMQQMDEVLRSSGQYGPSLAVPEDADAQTKLVAFIGRNPFWTAS